MGAMNEEGLMYSQIVYQPENEAFIGYSMSGVPDAVRDDEGRTVIFDSVKSAQAFIDRNSWLQPLHPWAKSLSDIGGE